MKETYSFLTGFLAMLFAAGLISSAGTAQANSIFGFQGPYAPVNWTLTTNEGNGSVDTSGAPTSITLVGSDTGSDIGLRFTDYTTLAVGDRLVSFSWDYETADNGGPGEDPFGYLIEGNYTQLSDNGGGMEQSGSASFSVLAGQTFGFRVVTGDDLWGPAESTISSFEAEVAAVPEIDPSSLGSVLALVLGSLGLLERRRLKAA